MKLILPNKRYSLIYLDPPWKYNSRANHKTRFRGGAGGHYPLMTMDEIKAINIPSISASISALLMWTTFPYLNDQIKLFKHWGFKYRTIAFAWIKINKNGFKAFKEFEKIKNNITEENFVDNMILIMDMLRFFGVGFYSKSNLEICLLGMKGQLPVMSNNISSVVFSKRREHSRKPDEIRDKIVQLFGNIDRIELFARNKTPGWDVLGNEINRFN